MLFEMLISTDTDTCVHSQRFGAFHQLWEPIARLPDKNSSGEGHAALASGSEGSSHQLVDGVLFIGVGHHYTVIFGTLI